MPSKFIGVIRDALTGRIVAVVNPDGDAELDNPRLLLLKGADPEAMQMVKVPRGDYEGSLSMDDVAKLVAELTS